MGENADPPKPDPSRDREFWFVAISFWALIAPIFLYGFAVAFRMPAELLVSWLDLAPHVGRILDVGSAALGFAFAVYAVVHVWRRLRASLANRAA